MGSMVQLMLHRLPDGTRVRIRPIRPSDKDLLAAGLRRLSPESAQRRFLAAKRAFSRAELAYLTEVDGHDHIALVAVDAHQPDLLIAVARCVRLGTGGDTADIAIVVGDPWQGQGLGRELLRRLAARAAAHGISSFSAIVLADNLPARRLLHTVATGVQERGLPDGLRAVSGDLAARRGAAARVS